MKKLLSFFLCFSFVLQAKIVEITYFADLKKYIEPNALVILDIDNTLITPVQEVGSDQWFRHRRKHYAALGYPIQEALELALAEWEAVQNITHVRTCESSTNKIIEELQESYLTMGLTARGLGLATRTIFQLKDVEIDLSINSLSKEDIPLLNPQAILFRKGILFTSGTHKGKALVNLFEKLNYTPIHIVFINDKAHNLREVEVACNELKIPFVGLRYGFLDEKVKTFRADIAGIQFENFKTLLSDQEAENLVERL